VDRSGQHDGAPATPVIRNPRTGEHVEFVVETPELLVMRSTWTRPGHRVLEHIHPEMEERFEVLAGTAAIRVLDVQYTAHPGDVVVAPPGVPHLAWNPTDSSVQLRITMTPALRWAEFTRRLFTGDDPGTLLREFVHEVILPR
jgi:quercetin dioxygenase-like cupin family protein